MHHRGEDLVHDSDDFDSIMQHEYNMGEKHRVVSANHTLRFNKARLAGNLMRNGLWQRVLDVPDRSFPAMDERTNHQD